MLSTHAVSTLGKFVSAWCLCQGHDGACGNWHPAGCRSTKTMRMMPWTKRIQHHRAIELAGASWFRGFQRGFFVCFNLEIERSSGHLNSHCAVVIAGRVPARVYDPLSKLRTNGGDCPVEISSTKVPVMISYFFADSWIQNCDQKLWGGSRLR